MTVIWPEIIVRSFQQSHGYEFGVKAAHRELEGAKLSGCVADDIGY